MVLEVIIGVFCCYYSILKNLLGVAERVITSC